MFPQLSGPVAAADLGLQGCFLGDGLRFSLCVNIASTSLSRLEIQCGALSAEASAGAVTTADPAEGTLAAAAPFLLDPFTSPFRLPKPGSVARC